MSRVSLIIAKWKQNGYKSAIWAFVYAQFVMLYPCVTPDILFLMTDLVIMQYFSEIISKSDQK